MQQKSKLPGNVCFNCKSLGVFITLLQNSDASGQFPELVSQPPVVRSKIWCLQEMRIRGCMLIN